jgi:hypothetical protein
MDQYFLWDFTLLNMNMYCYVNIWEVISIRPVDLW